MYGEWTILTASNPGASECLLSAARPTTVELRSVKGEVVEQTLPEGVTSINLWEYSAVRYPVQQERAEDRRSILSRKAREIIGGFKERRNRRREQSYEQGYMDGASNERADWEFALNEIGGLHDDFEYTPTKVGEHLARLARLVKLKFNTGDPPARGDVLKPSRGKPL